jgi:CubicO group peptidase (beta-lactamase class C family)
MIKVVDPHLVGFSEDRLTRISGWLEDLVASERVAGASVLVGRFGKPAYFRAAGMADLAEGKAFSEDTVVRIYSMTKPIVSVAAMMLFEEGCFQLDRPVSDYLPEFSSQVVWQGGDIGNTKPVIQPMLIWHLLTHTSGLTYDFMNQNVVDAEYRVQGITHPSPHKNLEGWVKALAEIPLISEPGTEWNYSVSTDVLGRLVEVWSGLSLEKLLCTRIFEPLGMHDTGFHVIEPNQARFASLYRPKVGPVMGDTSPPPLSERRGLKLLDAASASGYRKPANIYSGGGGLVSSISDYSRFCQMLMNGGEFSGKRLLSPVTVEYMRTNHLPDGKDMASMGQPVWSETTYDGIGFGLGFAVVLDPIKAKMITSKGEHHWGGAASTMFWLDPEKEMWVVFLTQLLPSSTYPIRRELRTLVYQAIVE